MLSLSPNAQAEIIDKIVAQVGDNIITQYDIESYAPATVRNIYAMPEGSLKKQAWQAYYDKTMDSLINSYIIQVATYRIGITTNDEEINSSIISLQQESSYFRNELNSILARNGEVTPEVRLYVQTVILQQKLMPTLRYRSVVTDEDITTHLRNDPDRVFEEYEYNLKVAFIPGSEAYETFKEGLGRSGFEDAGRYVGADTINMGWVLPNMLLMDMGSIVRNLEPGMLSEPLIDDEGRYVVVHVEDKRPSSGVSESEREYIINELRAKQMETVFNNWLDRTKSTILVQRYDQ